MIQKDTGDDPYRLLSRTDDHRLKIQSQSNPIKRDARSDRSNSDDAVVVRCRSVEQIRLAIARARTTNSLVSIHRGGRAGIDMHLCGRHIIVDLSGMRGVDVDPDASLVEVEAGLSAFDLMVSVASHGFFSVAGNRGSANIADLTLSGAYGPLSPRYGLALDCLLSLEIVLADGRLVTANAVNCPDLFWAIRGGGENFGVVTSMRFRMHRSSALLTAIILFPWSKAAEILRLFDEIAHTLPIELSLMAGIMSGYDGNPVTFLSAVWNGDVLEGERAIRDLQTMGTPLLLRINRMNHCDLLRVHDPGTLDYRRHTVRTRRLPKLTSETISTILGSIAKRTSPLAAVALYHFRGIPTKVLPDTAAFRPRHPHLVCEIIAAWDGGSNGEAHDAWARQLAQNLAIASSSAACVAQLSPREDERTQNISADYVERLRQVKQRYDPHHLFNSSAHPLF
jgi:FAD/FMN-containing dehydrogenase